jgi:hypothetical protein
MRVGKCRIQGNCILDSLFLGPEMIRFMNECYCVDDDGK